MQPASPTFASIKHLTFVHETPRLFISIFDTSIWQFGILTFYVFAAKERNAGITGRCGAWKTRHYIYGLALRFIIFQSAPSAIGTIAAHTPTIAITFRYWRMNGILPKK